MTFTGNLSHTGGLTVGNATTLSGLKTYSGDTIVAGHSSGTSLLRYTSANAISVNSNVVIGDASTVGLVQFGYSPAAITLGTGGGQFRFNGDGGFLSSAVSAVDVTLTLNGGAGLAWGAGNFIGDGDTFYLGTDRFNAGARELNLTNNYRSWSAAADRLRIPGIDYRSRRDEWHPFRHRRSAGRRRRPSRTQGNQHLYRRDRGAECADVRERGAINGGIGVAGGQSNLQLNGIAGIYQSDGIVVLTAASGDFLRGLGTAGDQVQWLSDGGFTAVGGNRTVNIGNGAALTWGAGGFVGDGERLVFGGGYGDSAINFQNAVNLGGLARTIEVNSIVGDGIGVNLNGVISGSGDLRIVGRGGDVALTAMNTFTGHAVLGDGDPATGVGDGLEVFVTNIGNSGVAGNLGAGDTVELRSHGGGLWYLGAGETTDRNFILGARNNAGLLINNDGSGALQLTGNVTKDATAPTNNLLLAGSFVSTDGNGDGIADNANIVSGVISETSGTLNVRVSDVATWRLTGDNTYSGNTVIDAFRTLEVDDLANGGAASSIGDSSSAAANLLLNGTLRYIGTGDSTDRLMQISGATRIDSVRLGRCSIHQYRPRGG